MVDGVRRSGLPGPADRWAALRDTIHANVLAHGFDADRNTFTQSYGSPALDASLLLPGRVGLGFCRTTTRASPGPSRRCSVSSPQTAWCCATAPEHSDDGLPGGDGVFPACSFWLVDTLVGLGRRTDARALFDRLLGLQRRRAAPGQHAVGLQSLPAGHQRPGPAPRTTRAQRPGARHPDQHDIWEAP